MTKINLIALSYHRFTQTDDPYVFSRTYKQFRNDLETKDFDWITIDDGHKSQIKAAKMMKDGNIRAKLFICPGMIGKADYCTWDDIWALSRDHDIENHSQDHQDLVTIEDEKIWEQIQEAQAAIKEHTGRFPRFFVPPWNHYDNRVEAIIKEIGLQLVKDRITIKNTTL